MDHRHIRVRPVTSGIGAIVEDVDLSPDADPAQHGELRAALLDHLVLFIPGRDADAAAQERLARVFGEPHPHPVSAFLGDAEVVRAVTRDAYGPDGDSHFHTDYSFHTEIPDVAVLRCAVAPDRGGDTIWTDMYAAFEALSPPLQAFLEGLEAVHDQGPQFSAHIKERFGAERAESVLTRFPGATHPMVTVHPETGRKVLFVNPGYTRRVVGLRPAESDALLRFLYTHLESARFTCRYRWAPGDIAVWDERCTLHKGEAAYWPRERLLHRVNSGAFTPRPVSAMPA